MATDNLQHQRLELKYIIPEATALAVRDFVRPLLTLDEYGVGQPDCSYPIHSLYLDSDRLSLYWETINGNKNRYKLRARYYDDRPDSPVFFEIKRRLNDAILKQRGGVSRAWAAEILAGRLPPLAALNSANPRQLAALQEFCRLMLRLDARPKALVSYRREAWISTHNNSVRITMDRHVKLGLDATTAMPVTMERPVTVFDRAVILELKFTDRFPDWFGDLVRHFGLRQCSAAKYADGLLLKLEAGLGPITVGEPASYETATKLQARRESLRQVGERSGVAFA